jgi:hypothetical protein
MADKYYDNSEYLKHLMQAKDSYTSAYDTLYKAYQYNLEQSKPAVKSAYDAARGGAYATARVSALGNNENLANAGLAGNAYAAPKSGYSESARIAQDVALQNNLNAMNSEERSAIQEIMQAMQKAQTQRTADIANYESNYQNTLATEAKYAEATEYSRREAAKNEMLNYAQGVAGQGGMLDGENLARFRELTGKDYVEDYLKYYNTYAYTKEKALSAVDEQGNALISENAKKFIKDFAGISGINPALADNGAKLAQNIVDGITSGSLVADDIDDILGVFAVDKATLLSNINNMDAGYITANIDKLKEIYSKLGVSENDFNYKLLNAYADSSLSSRARDFLADINKNYGGNPVELSGAYNASVALAVMGLSAYQLSAEDFDKVFKLYGLEPETFAQSISRYSQELYAAINEGTATDEQTAYYSALLNYSDVLEDIYKQSGIEIKVEDPNILANIEAINDIDTYNAVVGKLTTEQKEKYKMQLAEKEAEFFQKGVATNTGIVAKYNSTKAAYNIDGEFYYDRAGLYAPLGKGSGNINKSEAESWGFPNPDDYGAYAVISVQKDGNTYYYMKRGGKWVAMEKKG